MNSKISFLLLISIFVFFSYSVMAKEKKIYDQTYEEVRKIEFLVLVNKAQDKIIKDFICEIEIIIAKTDKEHDREKVDAITKKDLDSYHKLLDERKSIIMNEVIKILGRYEYAELSQSNTNKIQEEIRSQLKKFILQRFEKYKSAQNAEYMLESINFKMFKFQPN